MFYTVGMNSIPVVLGLGMPGGMEWGVIILVLLIVILLFGAKRLPDLAKSIGLSIKEFKKGIKEADSEDKTTAAAPKGEEQKKGNGQ